MKPILFLVTLDVLSQLEFTGSIFFLPAIPLLHPSLSIYDWRLRCDCEGGVEEEVTNVSTQPRLWEYLEPIYQWLSCVGLLGCMPLVECPRLFSLVDSGAVCTTAPPGTALGNPP